jgi:hypothetical protein
VKAEVKRINRVVIHKDKKDTGLALSVASYSLFDGETTAKAVVKKPSGKVISRVATVKESSIEWDTKDDLDEYGTYFITMVVRTGDANYYVEEDFEVAPHISDSPKPKKLKGQPKEVKEPEEGDKWKIPVWE